MTLVCSLIILFMHGFALGLTFQDRDRVHFRMPPTSPAPAQLTFSNDPKHSGKPYLGFAPTPFNSVPSSPLPVHINNSGNTDSASAAGRPLVRRDSIFDSTNPAIAARRDSLIIQRLQKVGFICLVWIFCCS